MKQPLSYIHPSAKIAKNVVIEPFTTIDGNVTIGEGTWIGPNVTIMDGAKIGKNLPQCVLHLENNYSNKVKVLGVPSML